MRMQEVYLEGRNIILSESVDISKPCAIIVSNGVAKLTELPPFAETKIITHQGQVKRIKWDEGEEF